MLERVQSAGVTVDVCIANAGVLSNERLADTEPASWWHEQEVNLRGTYACVRACLPGMLQHGGGTIICMSSAPCSVCSLVDFGGGFPGGIVVHFPA